MAETKRVEFNVGALLSRAWELYKGNLGVFLGGVILIGVVLGAANYFFFAGTIVLQGPLMLGLCGAALKEVRGGHSDLGDLFSGFQRFLPAMLANLVMSLFIAIGFILLVLPGIFVSMLYMPLFFMLADDATNNWWAVMERTRTRVMDNLGQWVILGLVLIGLNIAGAIVCGIGLLVTAPMGLLMIALAYEQSMATKTIDVEASQSPAEE